MKRIIYIIHFFLILFSTSSVLGATPVLYFSDITTGPKKGLGDGLGSGAIVTIWGSNLGSSQNNSKVYIGVTNNWSEASHVYYWENADPNNGDSGPADMYSFHQMQEIAFSIPESAPDGLVKIKVKVDGIDSNVLDFTIQTGEFYFVKESGNNSNDGSWLEPWKTLNFACGQGALKMAHGDIIYAVGDISETDRDGYVGLDIGNYGGVSGTENAPLSIIAYPGASISVYGTLYGIRNRNNNCAYWNLSKIKATTGGTGIAPFRGARIIGNEISNIDGGCADGVSGAISGGNLGGTIVVDNLKVFGNYVHDFGCEATSKYHHIVYLSNRSGIPVAASEFGWNYFTDNMAEHCLQMYDEGVCGDFTGTLKIHDNVVVNQRGVALGIASSGTTEKCFTMDVEVFNNLFVNVGKGPALSTGSVWTTAISITGANNFANIKLYNNTIYGYGDETLELYQRVGDVCVFVPNTFGGAWEWVNNIVYDTENIDFIYSSTKPPIVATNNLWFNGGDGDPSNPPEWDKDAILSNPMFINTNALDYSLLNDSPCKDSGTSIVDKIVKTDIKGVFRPQNGYDIGAFELFEGQSNISIPTGLLIVK